MATTADLSGNSPVDDVERSVSNESMQVWEGIDENFVFPIIDLAGAISDFDVQIVGTMGSATFVVKGGSDKDALQALQTIDAVASAITLTDTHEFFRDAPQYIQITQSGGTGVDVDVYLHKRSV